MTFNSSIRLWFWWKWSIKRHSSIFQILQTYTPWLEKTQCHILLLASIKKGRSLKVGDINTNLNFSTQYTLIKTYDFGSPKNWCHRILTLPPTEWYVKLFRLWTGLWLRFFVELLPYGFDFAPCRMNFRLLKFWSTHMALNFLENWCHNPLFLWFYEEPRPKV